MSYIFTEKVRKNTTPLVIHCARLKVTLCKLNLWHELLMSHLICPSVDKALIAWNETLLPTGYQSPSLGACSRSMCPEPCCWGEDPPLLCSGGGWLSCAGATHRSTRPSSPASLAVPLPLRQSQSSHMCFHPHPHAPFSQIHCLLLRHLLGANSRLPARVTHRAQGSKPVASWQTGRSLAKDAPLTAQPKPNPSFWIKRRGTEGILDLWVEDSSCDLPETPQTMSHESPEGGTMHFPTFGERNGKTVPIF